MRCWRCRARPLCRKISARWPISTSISTSAKGLPRSAILIKPVVTAKMLQAAEIKDTDKVLVVGCATGYAAAVVAKLAGQVTATESDSVAGREGEGGSGRTRAVEM